MVSSILDEPVIDDSATIVYGNEFEKCCIAIIDDEKINIDMIQYYLEMEGFKNLISTDNPRRHFQ